MIKSKIMVFAVITHQWILGTARKCMQIRCKNSSILMEKNGKNFLPVENTKIRAWHAKRRNKEELSERCEKLLRSIEKYNMIFSFFTNKVWSEQLNDDVFTPAAPTDDRHASQVVWKSAFGKTMPTFAIALTYFIRFTRHLTIFILSKASWIGFSKLN